MQFELVFLREMKTEFISNRCLRMEFRRDFISKRKYSNPRRKSKRQEETECQAEASTCLAHVSMVGDSTAHSKSRAEEEQDKVD